MAAYGLDDVPDQSGKLYVITGANSGLGLVTARELAKKGARVVLACRSVDKAESAASSIREAGGKDVEVEKLDLASLASVRAFAERFRASKRALDGLVNNAGLMALPRTLTEDGFEMQLGTNHLGHFALTALLFPAIVEAKTARIVNVSSLVHKRGKMAFDDLMGERRYDKWAAYAQSKLANLLFTRELAKRLATKHPSILATAAHPGYSATDLQRKGPEAEGSAIAGAIMKFGNALFAQSAERGALATLRALGDPTAKSGEYFGPGGPFEIVGAPIAVDTSAAAKSDADARRLWDLSEELTKTRFEI